VIRHWFNTHHARKGNPHWTWAVAVVIFIVIAWLSSAGKPGDAQPEALSAGAGSYVASPHFAAVKAGDRQPLHGVPFGDAGP